MGPFARSHGGFVHDLTSGEPPMTSFTAFPWSTRHTVRHFGWVGFVRSLFRTPTNCHSSGVGFVGEILHRVDSLSTGAIGPDHAVHICMQWISSREWPARSLTHGLTLHGRYVSRRSLSSKPCDEACNSFRSRSPC